MESEICWNCGTTVQGQDAFEYQEDVFLCPDCRKILEASQKNTTPN